MRYPTATSNPCSSLIPFLASALVAAAVGQPAPRATASGALARRPDDEFGLGLAVAWPDPEFPEAPVRTKPEAVVEVAYRWRATESVLIQPDMQYVANPSWTSRTAGAPVLTARLGLLL